MNGEGSSSEGSDGVRRRVRLGLRAVIREDDVGARMSQIGSHDGADALDAGDEDTASGEVHCGRVCDTTAE